jgi:hypothetical protein
MSLDAPTIGELLSEALRHVKQPKTKRTSDPEQIDPRALYTNPGNWRATRGVSLVHAESQTVLGAFQEYVHISEPGTRKLILSSTPIAISAFEEVSGDWWLSERHEIASPESWHERRTLILPLRLDHLGVQSPAVEVSVHLAHGSIARVELIEDTIFAQLEGAPDQLLSLPKGANILGVMGQDSKIALRVELQRQKEI